MKPNTKRLALVALFAAASITLFAQRDFLTPGEVEKVRQAQEPNLRLKLYVLFARQRLDQLQSTVAKNKTGRSAEIRTLLEEYTQVIDAMGAVSEDALSRRVDLTAGAAAVAEAEAKFLDQLQKLEDSNQPDLSLYHFQLTEAIIATSDSIDEAKSDQAERTREAVTKAADERRAVSEVVNAEKAMTKGPAGASGAAGDDAPKPARRPPTIYRPGEQPK